VYVGAPRSGAARRRIIYFIFGKYIIYYPNSALSIVVFTQNNRWNIIANINNPTVVYTSGVLVILERIKAAMSVKMTSTMAILKRRYWWTPFPGSPNMCLYLHKENPIL
jgi:hypothetical protein